MRRVKVAGALALAGIFLTACGAGAEGGYSDDAGESSVIPNKDSYVKMIDVNGTPCVIFNDINGGGIDCDWSNDNE
jgi:hypothetical protein